jgi:ElaB/YqjD/DUF883 family membrane-anchored ribosome-binding protein
MRRRNFSVGIWFPIAIGGKAKAMARRAKARNAGSRAQHKRRQVAGAGNGVRDKLAHKVDWSVENRPYTTLALAVGLGFVLRAVWAR